MLQERWLKAIFKNPPVNMSFLFSHSSNTTCDSSHLALWQELQIKSMALCVITASLIKVLVL